jgi:hypothetical protein
LHRRLANTHNPNPLYTSTLSVGPCWSASRRERLLLGGHERSRPVRRTAGYRTFTLRASAAGARPKNAAARPTGRLPTRQVVTDAGPHPTRGLGARCRQVRTSFVLAGRALDVP